ncbi:MAG: hypothetical protein WC378_07455 [Opitutaceae bacterium]
MHLKTHRKLALQHTLRSAAASLLTLLAVALMFTASDAYAVFGERITVSGTQFKAGAQRIWINGANTPWKAWNDFGGKFDAAWWTNHFQELRDNNINATRVWISCSGDVGIDISPEGVVSGATAAHWADLDTLFQIARSKGVYIMATLISFDHTDKPRAKHLRWRAMLSSGSNVDSYVSNYVIPVVKRYKDNPFLWSIDLCNEPDWIVEDAKCGPLSWDIMQVYFAKVAVAIHENSGILVTVGIAMGPKYNCPNLGEGNKVGDAALQAKVNNPAARLDFWSPHHYDWQTSQWGNPFNMTPVAYGLDGSKPALIGECPAMGTAGQTVAQDYENGFVNGWQGAQGWTSNGVDRFGGLTQLASATNAFKKNHGPLVYPAADALVAPAGNAAPSAR